MHISIQQQYLANNINKFEKINSNTETTWLISMHVSSCKKRFEPFVLDSLKSISATGPARSTRLW